ncbi:MAG: hypothetical protein II709_02095 [Ruminococcus sp.]|nr:hypothetical protein [Ruminococcus sp.]
MLLVHETAPQDVFHLFSEAVKNLILRKPGKMPEHLMHRKFFGYLTLVDDFDEQIVRYWDKKEDAVKIEVA